MPAPDPIAEEARVTVTMTIPAVTFSPDTKSLGEEIELNSLRLAIFGSSGYLKEYVSAKNLQKVEDVSYENPLNPREMIIAPCFTFTASLPLSDSKRTIHFIGNGPSTLPFGAADEVLPKLMTYLNPESAEDQIQGFWQMIELPDGIAAKKKQFDDGEYYVDQNGVKITPEGLRSGTQHYVVADATQDLFQGVQLVRNWARIKVTADREEKSNFRVISYALYNAPSRGAIVPYNSRKGIFMENYQAKTFKMLEDEEYPANLPVGAEFTKPEFEVENFRVDNGEFEKPDPQGRVVKAADVNASVFLYERPIPSDRIPPTFIIVYGHFTDPDKDEPGHVNQSGDYFYKVDIYEVNREEGVSRYFPVYRNFQYDINISKILSPGHSNPSAAAAAAGNADVSSDVTTSHLLDISDGRGRLVIAPWISHTFTSPVRSGSPFSTILQAIFYKPGESGQVIDMSSAEEKKVYVELRPMTDGLTSLITKCEIGDPIADGEQKGWRTITFTTDENTIGASRSQTIRISGTYKDGEGEDARDVTLYRDVVITVQPKQDMQVSIESSDFVGGAMPREIGKQLTLHVDIPDGLVESMFPLQFTIEPEDMTLTPVDTDLPVFYGPSISRHDGYKDKSAFYFIRTITYEQYRAFTRWTDDMDLTWCRFDCHFKTTKADNATTIWVQNDEYFNFTDDSQASFSNIGKVPREKMNYFYVEAADDAGCQVQSGNDGRMYLQTEKVNETTEYWVKEEGWSGSTGKTITLKKGDRVYFKADVMNWSGEDKLKVDGNFNVGGNIASLVVGDDFVSKGVAQTGVNFSSFLKNKTGLIDASNLTIPMTKLTNSTFQSMFEGCTAMTAAPSSLPATTLSNNCYYNMFKGCTSLATAPSFPTQSMTLAESCCQSMFQGCTSLTAAPPSLLAKNLIKNCYRDMFNGCTSLATAPAFPTESMTLAESCCQSMFQGCTSLRTAPGLTATTLANNCYRSMFQGCISLTTAPALPASRLVSGCYGDMFNGCSSLLSVTCMATSGINSSYSTTNWLSGVPNTADKHGTFVCSSSVTIGTGGWPRSYNGIPDKWIVNTVFSPAFPDPFDQVPF